VTLLLRPSGARITPQNGLVNILRGQVADVIYRMEGYRVSVRFDGEVLLQFYLDEAVQIGQQLPYTWRPNQSTACLNPLKELVRRIPLQPPAPAQRYKIQPLQ
jgi:hypothetical protein